MRGEDSLAIAVVETQSNVEARGWPGEIEMNSYLKPRPDRQAFDQRLLVFRKEFEPLEQGRDDGPAIAYAVQFHYVPGS